MPGNSGSIELVQVTPDLAREWLSQRPFRGQRKLDRETVLLYSRLMKMGEFDALSQVNFATVGDDTFLTDGQHRLNAVVHSEVTTPFVVRTRILEDELSVAADYNSANGKSRTVNDSFRATGIQESLALSSTQLNMISAATALIEGGFSPRSNRSLLVRSTSDKEKSIRDWNNEFRQYQNAITGAHQALSRVLKWRGVTAVGMVTFRYAPFKAQQFWGDLVSEDNRTKAGNYLERRLLFSGIPKTKNMATVSRTVAEAWNRLFLGKHLAANFTPLGDSVPIYIAGSPFTGSQQVELFPDVEVVNGEVASHSD